MLTFEQIKKDLDETQQCIDIALSIGNYNAASQYTLKMSQIVVWFMQNKYVEE